jgi:pimeloyl-ACP methyl ester carboxylesterase
MKYLILVVKILVSIAISAFALATFLGKAYLQTFSLTLLIVSFFYWPLFRNKKAMAFVSNAFFILLMLLLQLFVFKGEPKQSIYKSPVHRNELHSIYLSKMSHWPIGTEQLKIDTKYGKVNVLAYGEKNLPSILLFHAASMGAHSWAENLEPLIGRYRIFAIDNIGEGNLSELRDPLFYPESSIEIADHYAFITNKLGIERSPVFGSSNGGYIAQVYAYYYPEKVESMVLLGPMGITPLTMQSIFMLSVSSLYPLEFVREQVTGWAFGNNDHCREKYGDWFQAVLKGTIPSVAQPKPLTNAQKKELNIPVIIFLGTKDPIVGDAETAKILAEAYPDIEIHILDSGHLIAIEQREIVNKELLKFLDTGR